MAHKFLKFAQLRRDPALQSRVAMDEELIGEYTDAILRGDRLPPASVVFDKMYYYLVDGWHRCAALEAAGKCEVEAEVTPGTYRDAQLASCAANSKNGARRTNADKKRAVERMLADEEWARCSDNDIAKHCAVSQPFASSVRSSLITALSEKPSERTYTTKHGTQATMRTAGIGRKPKGRRVAAIEQSATPAMPAQPWPFPTAANPHEPVSPDANPNPDDDEQPVAPEVQHDEPEIAALEAKTAAATIDAGATDHFGKLAGDRAKEIEKLKDRVAKLENGIRKRDATIRKLKADLKAAKHESGALMRGFDEAVRRKCQDVNYRTRQADGGQPSSDE
jgi:hypothetical protein